MTTTNDLLRTDAVRGVSKAISSAHLFIYAVPEAREEAARLGVTERSPAYFGFRSAALGTVPWQVVHAAFYNFEPGYLRAAVTVASAAASPAQWQTARFSAAQRALHRVGVSLTAEQIDEARSLLGRVVAGADHAGKPMAAANAALPLPVDPLTALWQQITIVREWRGDAHLVALAANGLGPCECNVLHTATGRLPVEVIRATRGWTDDDWAAATSRLAARGWLDDDAAPTEAGAAARERIEVETDELCLALWAPIGDDGTRRLTELLTPITAAFHDAGTFAQLL